MTTAAIVCFGGTAAIGSVTGVMPLRFILPDALNGVAVVKVAEPNTAHVPDIAPAVVRVPVVAAPTTEEAAAPKSAGGNAASGTPSPRPSIVTDEDADGDDSQGRDDGDGDEDDD